jgi:hypothetical protein
MIAEGIVVLYVHTVEVVCRKVVWWRPMVS